MINPFSEKVRVRANGIVFKDDKLVLVQIKSPTRDSPFWMPPGGGVLFGEPLKEAVKREVKEETNLDVKVGDLWYVTEYLKDHWHAIEFYYRCHIVSGELKLGSDPELEVQMLQKVDLFDLNQTNKLDVKPSFFMHQLNLDYPDKRKETLFLPSDV